jgi:hypothetical protein
MAHFNLNDYQTVEERIHLFWERYPNGRIINDIIFDDGERVVIRSEVYTDREDTRPAAVDFAEELKSTKGVNQTSRVENGVTSATGRALSLLGGEFSPKGKRPSRQEMEKVQRMTQPQPQKPVLDPRRQAILDRLNALPDAVRTDAKREFLDAFGKPDSVEEEFLEEAGEFITMIETGKLG